MIYAALDNLSKKLHHKKTEKGEPVGRQEQKIEHKLPILGIKRWYHYRDYIDIKKKKNIINNFIPVNSVAYMK